MCYINKLALPILLIKGIVIILFVYILIPLLTVNKRENVSTVCSGAAVLSAVKIKVPSRTHRPNRKTYRPIPIFEILQISANHYSVYLVEVYGINYLLFFCVIVSEMWDIHI